MTGRSGRRGPPEASFTWEGTSLRVGDRLLFREADVRAVPGSDPTVEHVRVVDLRLQAPEAVGETHERLTAVERRFLKVLREDAALVFRQ